MRLISTMLIYFDPIIFRGLLKAHKRPINIQVPSPDCLACVNQRKRTKPNQEYIFPLIVGIDIDYLVVFIISDYKNLYLLSILHLYRHLFAELVHL